MYATLCTWMYMGSMDAYVNSWIYIMFVI